MHFGNICAIADAINGTITWLSWARDLFDAMGARDHELLWVFIRMQHPQTLQAFIRQAGALAVYRSQSGRLLQSSQLDLSREGREILGSYLWSINHMVTIYGIAHVLNSSPPSQMPCILGVESA